MAKAIEPQPADLSPTTKQLFYLLWALIALPFVLAVLL